MPEFITNLLQNAGAIELIAGTVLAVLGVRNRDQIMAAIKSLLGGKDGDNTPLPTPTPDEPSTGRLADEIGLLRAKAVVTEFGDKYQHQQCAAEIREKIAHMLTDSVDEQTEPANA